MLVTFLDNHDVMRLWDLVSGDVDKYKMALVMLFTMRGIPQVYYGTEVGLQGGDDHGLIRRDMPGGFPADTKDMFESGNLNSEQESIISLIKDLINLRKENAALTLGNFNHFLPENELYYYTRQFKDEKVLIFINNKTEKINLNQNKLIKENNFEILLLSNGSKIKEKQYVELGKYGYAILKIG